MEQKKQLEVVAKDFLKWYDQLANAQTFDKADEAKVEGLKSWIKYTQQLNRVRGEFLELSIDTRARISANVRNRVRELTRATQVAQTPEEPTAESKTRQRIKEAVEKDKVISKSKKAKKAKK